MADFDDKIELGTITWYSPWPELKQVTLSRETWVEHIVAEHTYLEDKLDLVRTVVESASHVFQGTSTQGTANPDYVVYVNEDVKAKTGAPLAAFVSPRTGQLRTALFHRSFKNYETRGALWSKK